MDNSNTIPVYQLDTGALFIRVCDFSTIENGIECYYSIVCHLKTDNNYKLTKISSAIIEDCKCVKYISVHLKNSIIAKSKFEVKKSMTINILASY